MTKQIGVCIVDYSNNDNSRFVLPETILEGERNEVLYRFACSLQAKGLGGDDIERELLEVNAQRCCPPLPEGEVAKIARHVDADYPKGLSPEYAERAAAARIDGTGGSIVKAPEGGKRAKVPGQDDMTLSQVFARRYRGRLLYVIEAKGWYAYDGMRWVKDSEKPKALIKEFVGEGNGGDSYRSYVKRKNLLEDVKCELSAHTSEFDTRTDLLNVRNGTLNLQTLELQKHDPNDMITKVAGCEYDPQAPCERWKAFLESTLITKSGNPDDELITFLQRALGAALCCDTSLERFYLLVGPTRSGKSTFTETIIEVFGEYGATIQPETLAVTKRNAGSASDDVARLEGVRLVVCPESEKSMLLDVARVKQWTGGDTITARRVYENERNFRPYFTLCINTNHLPDVNDQTLFEGGRAVVVPFTRHREPSERDPSLKADLRTPASLSGVLNWLVRGCSMRGEMGTTLPAACKEAGRMYETESDKVGLFIEERCTVGAGEESSGQEIYDSYRSWCEDNGRTAGTAQNLYSELERRNGIERIKQKMVKEGLSRKKKTNWFKGISTK